MSWVNASGAKVDHPFMRNCEKTTETPVEGTVISGKIPQWLHGHVIRNGPGIQKIGETSYKHAFDGLAILHKFTVKDGKGFYQSRALESEAYQRNMAANRIVVSEFGTATFPDPCQSLLGRLQSKFVNLMGKSDNMEMTDNCSVNVAYYGDQLYAMTETVFIRRVDPETLKTVGDKTRIRDYCALNTATAHPHELEDGTILNVGNNFRHKQGPHYCFVKVPPKFGSDETAYKDAKIIAEIPSRWKFSPGYSHSFGMTKDKIIFIEQPLCMDLVSLMKAPLFDTTFDDALKWYPKEKARIHVVSMENGKHHNITYETDKLFTFHHINAFEENGFLFVDVAGYNDAMVEKNLTFDQVDKLLSNTYGGSARRYILPLNVEGAKPGENLIEIPNTDATATLRKGTTTVVDLTPHHFTKDLFELPRINYAYNGKKYNFVYGLQSTLSDQVKVPKFDKITKVNTKDGSIIEYNIKGEFATEPIFVENPTNPSAEDDGVIISAILQKDPKEVDLIILNAKDMTEIADIKFQAEGAVTSTFHGSWTNMK